VDDVQRDLLIYVSLATFCLGFMGGHWLRGKTGLAAQVRRSIAGLEAIVTALDPMKPRPMPDLNTLRLLARHHADMLAASLGVFRG
jgi:hypothetical protein